MAVSLVECGVWGNGLLRTSVAIFRHVDSYLAADASRGAHDQGDWL